ncbi:MAG: beta-lactamase family protein, partial [Gammaproteobacteria bacterium]|nr:beta-lactamase family protein [Gammaproteobacteria bacterium]
MSKETMIRRALIGISLAAVGAVWAGEEFNGYSLEQSRAFHKEWNLDDWDEGGPLMRYVFLNMSEFWNHSLIARGGQTRELQNESRDDVAAFVTSTARGEMPLAEYVDDSTVNGVIVLHRGKIVFEEYPRMLPGDMHNYMSISKGFTATLVALLEERQLIDVDRTIETYLPSLKGSGWDGVPVLDILDMASGIGCLEGDVNAYTDPDHCYYQFEASLGWVRPTAATPASTYEYMATLESHRAPGERFEYTSPDTFVLGWLAESVTGRMYADLLSSEIWQKIGAESDAIITAPRRGVPIAHGGISSTLRDLARFGLAFTPSGRTNPGPLISDAYLDRIQKGGRPEIFNDGREDDPQTVDGEAARHNSYQWDFVMEDGDFFKGGFGGQGLYISPSRDLV